MSEAINIIKKAVNTNFKEPLNKLIEKSHSEIMNKTNNTSGCSINPALEYTSIPTIASNATRPYLTNNQEEITINSPIPSGNYFSNNTTRYGNEIWYIKSESSIYYLYSINLIDGTSTLKLTFEGTKAFMFTVTKSYVYGYETVSGVNYLFRYNKETGEYKRSVNAIDSFFTNTSLAFLSYNDKIYAYYITTSTTDTKKGYYQITDILEYGGSFSYTKINDIIPELFFGSSYAYSSFLNTILELEDDYILYVGKEGGYYYVLLKINTITGESTCINLDEEIYVYSGSSYRAWNPSLCPIEYGGKLVGALFGMDKLKVLLIKIDGSDVSYTHISMITYKHEIASGSFGILSYKDDVCYLYDYGNSLLIKDLNLMVCDTNYVCYIPKGAKYYNSEIDKVLKVIPKLRDSISIEDGEIKYMGYVECNEDHIFEFTEGGFYFIPGSFYNSMISNKRGLIFHLNGTFF